jgi:aryl sulfotransferase
MPRPVRYRSDDEDSARWLEFPFRAGDIVISTRSKCGTTWMQMICALLVLQRTELPAPMRELSPWLDWLVEPRVDVFDRLERQAHRRFIKTHTPLDGVPLVPSVHYVVVAREPIDAAVSLYHQGANLDRGRIAELTGMPARVEERTAVDAWLGEWIDWDGEPAARLDSLVGVMWHLSDAWHRRSEPNVHLVRYEDLLADLEGAMRTLAVRLRIDVPEGRWPELAEAARFESMRDRAGLVAPGPEGVLKSRQAFFRRGVAGDGMAALDDAGRERYERRLGELGEPPLLRWLRGGS